MLSRFVIALLPRSKCLLILWLQPPSAVILEPKKRKSVTVSIVFPSICHERRGLDAMILVFWMLSFKPAFFFFLAFEHFFKFYFIFKLYKVVLVLPNIKMNPPQVYMCSPSWTLLPPPCPYHPSGSSQCTSPKHPVSCIEPGQLSSFTFIKMFFSSSSPSSIMVVSSIYLWFWYFSWQSWFQPVLSPIWYLTWCTLHIS